ncbi:hypothetical protein PMAYCL1PPCAC_21744, partial [Pristionchus mayeri]
MVDISRICCCSTIGIILVALALSCVLVFLACSKRNPSLMIPIIIIQFIAFVSIVGNAIYQLVFRGKNYPVWAFICQCVLYALAIIGSG